MEMRSGADVAVCFKCNDHGNRLAECHDDDSGSGCHGRTIYTDGFWCGFLHPDADKDRRREQHHFI